MLKNISVLLIMFGLIVIPVLALADDTKDNVPVTTRAFTDKKMHILNGTGTAQNRLEAMKIKSEERTEAMRDKASSTREGIQEKREAMKIKSEERTEAMRDKASSTREGIQEKREAIREKLSEARKSRVKGFITRMIRRVNAAFKRMSGIIERTESRIAKLNEKRPDIDISEALRFIESAKTDVETGKAVLSGINDVRDEIIEISDKHRDAYEKLRAIVREAITHLKSARENLKNAVRSIKAQTGSGNDDNEDNDDSSN